MISREGPAGGEVCFGQVSSGHPADGGGVNRQGCRMLALPVAPVAPKGGMADARRQAGQILLLPSPPRLEPASRPGQLFGRWPVVDELSENSLDSPLQIGWLGPGSALDLDKELPRPLSRHVRGLDPGGQLLLLDQGLPEP